MFAAARWHGVAAPGPYAGLRAALLGDDGTIRDTIMARATQTNEAGRLATLVPAFAALAQGEPLALVEAGGERRAVPLPRPLGLRVDAPVTATVALGPVDPRLTCAVDGPVPFPDRLPEVAWRGGIDLNPLDVTDDDHMAWLTNLVWPEHDDRRRCFAGPSRSPPPTRRRSCAVTCSTVLPAQVARAAEHGRVVVFHSAVIAYLDADQRGRFTRDDDRPGRRRRLPLGEQRGTQDPARGPPRPARRCPTTRPGWSSASTAARWPGPTATAGR